LIESQYISQSFPDSTYDENVIQKEPEKQREILMFTARDENVIQKELEKQRELLMFTARDENVIQ